MPDSIKMALLQNAVKDILQLSIVETLDEKLPPPLGMGHSLTSTTHPTTTSSSMLMLGMMPPIHQLLPREGMYMLLLVPRISPLLRNPTQHSYLKTYIHQQMTSIKYIKSSIPKGLLHHYLGSRGIIPKRPPPLHPISLL